MMTLQRRCVTVAQEFAFAGIAAPQSKLWCEVELV
jgi:hypothetical protein